MTDKKINAMPTKELFIDMLTRDIPLIPAIIDLVDNCADGARKMEGDGSYNNLWARLEISPEEFRIVDNCGGISVEIARKYAFRFGRASDMPLVKHSIGEFGVGMKRAIFKLGSKFKVESLTETSRFVVEEDVRNWASKPKWEYEFSIIEEDIEVKEDKRGTTITVTNLHEDVSHSFGLENFKTELANEMKARLQDPISKGLAVTLNGIPVDAEPLELLGDDQLAPAFKELQYGDSPENRVKVKLYCGLGKMRDPALAGWHVFCNGRLILEADKTYITGWGDKSNGISIPGFHMQFNHLRGYAYFDSDDPGRLPWNTTKTGLNTDSSVYRATKLEMMRLMRPVVDFLNKLKDEKADREDEDGEKGPLEQLIERSKTMDVADVQTRDIFKQPTIMANQTKVGPKMQRIQYDVPLDKVIRVKKALKAHSFKQVGEKTFDYFYNAEVDE
ncbi:MAG: ATP-binding protein [Candidatus Latescibacter sp.]|nr:ATP-binding protein [Candidatus Latescibacter sp.]